MLRLVIAIGVFVSATCAAAQQAAQSVDVINAEADRLRAEATRDTAEKDRLNAQADAERARITALGLPSFENTTKLNDGAGKLEEATLASDALGGAASVITDKLDGTNTYLVLAGDEAVDFWRFESLRAEMDAIHALFVQARPSGGAHASMLPAIAAVAGVKAVAGLFSSTTEVTSLDLTSVLPSRVLALTVAGKLAGRARLSAAILRSPELDFPVNAAWKDLPVAAAFSQLVSEAEAARAQQQSTPKPDKDTADLLDRALTRYKTFYDKATASDDKGVVPIVAAAKSEALAKSTDAVLRVYVEQAGGSLVNSKNLATTLGVDPVKVSGGVIVSYLVTTPTSGAVVAGGVISCRSTLTSLRRVQTGAWRKRAGNASSRCDVLG
uniref:hypothetical protein n=1 Tax=uncultured Sphingomonas sp. TaxID=158754 RepID=UPI0035CB0A47